MKNIIYTVLDNGTTTENLPIPVGRITRRFGCAFAVSADSIFIRKPGYYKVTFSAIANNGTNAAVLFEADIMQNGAAVPGGSISETIAATANKTVTRSVIVRNYNSGSNIQVIPRTSGVGLIDLSVTIEEV